MSPLTLELRLSLPNGEAQAYAQIGEIGLGRHLTGNITLHFPLSISTSYPWTITFGGKTYLSWHSHCPRGEYNSDNYYGKVSLLGLGISFDYHFTPARENRG
jgi:hypothetical protein